MPTERMPFEEFEAEVERVAGYVDGLGGNGAGTFWIDLYGPAPATADLTHCAAAVYGDVTRVTGTREVPAGRWRRLFTASFLRGAGFGTGSSTTRRRDAAFQCEWLCELVTETLGPVRAAAIVTHDPKSWYAALWEDWLLVGEESAVVLSLVNDS